MNSAKQLRLTQLEHLADLSERYKQIKAFQAQEERLDQHGNYTWDEQDEAMCKAFVTRACKAISTISGPKSLYTIQAMTLFQAMDTEYHQMVAAECVANLVEELHNELSLESMDSFLGLVHAEVFDDLISMSQHLLDEGYKDAAAVMCGGALESHLRRLCSLHGIDTLKEGKYRNAQRLNQDLGKVAYSRYDQKMVTAWLDIRNSAAHGHYDDYSNEQVLQFIDWLNDFIERNPA